MQHHALVATVVASCVLCACASSPTRGPASGVRGACAELAAETRAKVVTARSQTSVGASEDTLLEYVAPYGRCAEPTTSAGAWAFEIVDLSIEAVEVPSYDEESEVASTDGAPASIRVTARPVFITLDGKRVFGADDIELPWIDEMIDASGAEFFPPWPHESAPAEVTLDTDWNGDGIPEALVEGPGLMAPLVFDGGKVSVYAPATVLPTPTVSIDFDGDGRRDVGDDTFFDFDLFGEGQHFAALRLLARARPDGTFVTDDPTIRSVYAKACEGHGSSPWLIGRSDEASITNVVCGLMLGVPGATISLGVDDEYATLPEDYADQGDANLVLAMQTESLREWVMRPLPMTLSRLDGLTVLPVTAAATSSNEPTTKGYRFEGQQAIDGDRGTSWQAKKSDAKPWLELTLAAPAKVVALEIANGFQRQDGLGDLFLMNRRATSVKVTAGKQELTIALDAGARGYQLVRLPEPMTTAKLRLTVTASAAGSKWQNVALSDVRVLTAP